MNLKIIRNKLSYDFIIDKNKKENFDNNIKNNCKDELLLIHNSKIIFQCNEIQTVANYPNAHVLDTVKPCNFKIRCFIKTGESFADPSNPDKIKIHGIINAVDNEGQSINFNSLQIDNNQIKGRWLIHSTYYPKLDKDTNYAYSQGCFIFKHTYDLQKFNSVLLNNNITENMTLDGILIEK